VEGIISNSVPQRFLDGEHLAYDFCRRNFQETQRRLARMAEEVQGEKKEPRFSKRREVIRETFNPRKSSLPVTTESSQGPEKSRVQTIKAKGTK